MEEKLNFFDYYIWKQKFVKKTVNICNIEFKTMIN